MMYYSLGCLDMFSCEFIFTVVDGICMCILDVGGICLQASSYKLLGVKWYSVRESRARGRKRSLPMEIQKVVV